MDARKFLEHFGTIATAPNGVKSLRELILHLGVSGRIVPRSPSKENADDAIKKAIAQKREYHARLGLRYIRYPQELLTEKDYAFQIPSHWKWERLGNIACYLQRGKSPTYDSVGTTRVVSQKCVQWTGFDLSSARHIVELSVKNYGRERFLTAGDILWNSTGTGTAGRVVVYPGYEHPVVADSHITVIRLTNFDPSYLWTFLASPSVQQRMIPGQENSMVVGTTNQVELLISKVIGLPIPCPPIAEQTRIVAKVNELMRLCDVLEEQQKEQARQFPVLSGALHARFAESVTEGRTLREFDSIDTLSFEDLRKTILVLAFHGKIVPQDPAESSAEGLLREIQRRVGSGQRRPPLGKNDPTTVRPFQLPRGWTWAHFSQLGTFGRGKSQHRPRNDPSLYSGGQYPIVQTGDVARADGVIETYSGLYNEAGLAQSKLWPAGTLCITIAANIADSGILGFDACFPDSVVGFIPSDLLPSVRYFEYFMRTAKDALERFAPSTAQKNINLGSLEQILIPIPPASEQKRIVAKIDQLLALLTSLEAQQNEKDALANLFAKACVATFTGSDPNRTARMKPPKTELVSVITTANESFVTSESVATTRLAAIVTQHEGTVPARTLWQQSGLDIETFYRQLKTEIDAGWLAAPPNSADMKLLEETPA